MLLTLENLRERIPYHGALLGFFSLMTSAALIGANLVTLPAIEQAARDDLKVSLLQVLPEGLADNDLLADTLSVADQGVSRTVYRGRKAGAFSAAVFDYSARGYAGEIKVLVGVDAAGTVMGVRVLKHAETPGLGDKIEVAKSDWIHAFEKKSLENLSLTRWAVKKDGGEFDQFAGATITPRAVVKAVKEGLQFYAAHRAEISGEAK
ncbi:electron transport complex subunit RsxG [Uliginosibacterium sp. 31-12]|uniref:electron transport complex subunit RsxG n=1 Tax=Uliginosibacterium sp. 31-12 TaxID=3062781 RepID=UPI0026E2385A|nr:electron transport complex subunit RsxG [Uliginosibacterium sp. 31-12]MDO6388041.1 electron transport complex subunit RsxG [Uliginosibacterium sp. 31-12]